MGSHIGRSDFLDFIQPVGERMKVYDPTQPPTHQPKNDSLDLAKQIPPGFIDAMIVREQVFVHEQKVPLENEFDTDDARSFHWVAYASIPAKAEPGPGDVPNGDSTLKRRISSSTKVPIGTIRLVPPPHAHDDLPKPTPKADTVAGDSTKPSAFTYDGKEAYIKLGRLAVIPEYRKAGISKLLIESALFFARMHPDEILPRVDPAKMESLKQESDRGAGLDWKGLVLLHAQVGVQKLWKRYGFETDSSLGTWDEEGIEHVAMWRRLDLTEGRRRSKPPPYPIN